MVAIIVLAAGMSRRYGANKLLLPFGAGTVISTVLTRVTHTAAQPIVVVTGHEAERVRAELRARLPGAALTFIHNPDYETGEMLSSVKAGLSSLLPGPAGAAMIVLGDQPLIRLDVIERLRIAFEQNCGDLIAPRFGMNGRRGHPVLIGRRWWNDVLALPVDSNVRDLLRAHPASLVHMVVSDDSILGDVDTPAAYQAALKQVKQINRDWRDSKETT
jgi:molybdenum cofactor cytidylyltransferase